MMMHDKAPFRRRRQRWVLTALGVVFAASAIMRLGTIDLAFAQSQEVAALATPPDPAMTQTLTTALHEVEALRQELDGRALALADREMAVARAQMLVEERLAELAAAETRLEGLIALSDTAAETDLDRLTAVYETMPATEAAAIFGQMDASFAAGFLTRMAPAASASLMAELTPEQAYAVSVVIATRNATAPRMQDHETSRSETKN
jgi:flagellar motility protein MotE (MotC chaperone)